MSSPTWHDPRVDPGVRADLLLADMSAEEKLAQLGCVFPFGEHFDEADSIARGSPLGIGEVSTLEMRRFTSLEEAARWQRAVQEGIMTRSPHGVPAIFHMEGLCGPFIQDGTSFPSGIARGAAFDPELEEKIGAIVSRQEAACGITHILAPVLDVARDPRMGRYGESYGEDATLAAVLGAAYVRGAQGESTAGRRPECVAKHFLAFHNSQGGIHGTHSETPSRLLREVYGKPFQAAIAAGLRGIMPSYNSLDGLPVSLSADALTVLLREEMGFEGLCVSDYGAVDNAHQAQRIGETVEQAGYFALAAGLDVEMPARSGFAEGLLAVLRRERALALLDRATHRVLTAKFRMGLYEKPFAEQGAALVEAFHRVEDAEIARRAAQESLVLLKNDAVLPLSPQTRRIAVIGPHGNNPRRLFGGYTHMCMMESVYAVANSIAGVAGTYEGGDLPVRTVPGTPVQLDEGEYFDAILRRQKPGCLSLVDALCTRLPDAEVSFAEGYPVAGDDESGFAQALDLAAGADVVVLTLGGKHGTCSMATMGEGVDATSVNLPRCQEEFIRRVSDLDKPLIGVHFDGRPISSDVADACLGAIVEAWSPAEKGAEAVTAALLGDINPGGRLPVSVARGAGQIPVYYNHPFGSGWHQAESIGFTDYVDMPHTPRYPFGYGLSYTSFEYGPLRCASTQVAAGQSIVLSVDVRNAGTRSGDEVVQLYGTDVFASRSRPVQELLGFARVRLDVGGSVTVRFTVQPSQFAFLDDGMRWKVEAGEFEFRVGSSSEDVRSSLRMRVRDDAWINGAKRAMVAMTAVEESS